MNWKVGQQVICDRPGQPLTRCTVQVADVDSVVIACPDMQLVICGKRETLESLGWRLTEQDVFQPLLWDRQKMR